MDGQREAQSKKPFVPGAAKEFLVAIIDTWITYSIKEISTMALMPVCSRNVLARVRVESRQRSIDRCSHVDVRRETGNARSLRRETLASISWRSGRLFVCHCIAEWS